MLRRQLESVLGVGQVKLIGGRLRQINVIADPAKLAGLGLTAAEVAGALTSQNVQLPGGRVEQGLRDLTLRTYGRVATAEAFGDIAITNRDGTPVRVSDVARVEDGVEEAETLASVNGEPAVVLQVRKQSGTNTIEVVERVKDRLETPEGPDAEGLPARRRARPVRVHRDRGRHGEGAPRPRVALRRRGRVVLPAPLPPDPHLRDRHPELAHRHLRRHALHGLHAQRHHAAGAHAGGRHRHRRRGRRAREHLPLHGGEEPAADAGGGRRARRRSASPSSRAASR